MAEPKRAASVYYTLTPLGRSWVAKQAPNPHQYTKVLKGLGELIAENDIPRLPSTLAHLVGVTPPQVETALASLVSEGYVQTGRLPQPIEKGETPKRHRRSEEQRIAAEARAMIKAQESQHRYGRSEKGKWSHYAYEHSEKGIVKNDRYWKNRGLLVQKAFRIRRNISSMTALHIDPKLIAIEQQKLNEVNKQLEQTKRAKET